MLYVYYKNLKIKNSNNIMSFSIQLSSSGQINIIFYNVLSYANVMSLPYSLKDIVHRKYFYYSGLIGNSTYSNYPSSKERSNNSEIYKSNHHQIDLTSNIISNYEYVFCPMPEELCLYPHEIGESI